MPYNKERKKEYDKKYFEKNQERLIAKSKKYHQDNLERIKLQRKEYRQRNRELILARKKEDYEKNKDKRREHRKEYRAKVMQRFLSTFKLGKCCSVCGYKEYPEILQFHHKGDKSFNISTIRKMVKSELLEKEIKKCTLLCPNCHSWLHSSFNKKNKENIKKKETGLSKEELKLLGFDEFQADILSEQE
jgi:hypothetical protein